MKLLEEKKGIMDNIKELDGHKDQVHMDVLEDTDVEMISVGAQCEVEMEVIEQIDSRGGKELIVDIIEWMLMCIGVAVAAAKVVMTETTTMETSNKDRSIKESVDRLKRSLDENFESFGSEGASVIGEIFGIIDPAEAEQDFEDMSDPNIEDTFTSMVYEIVNHPGQISDHVNNKISGLEESLHQGSFDKIGGKGTLRKIWARPKRLHTVCGVKRKLVDRDWEMYGPIGPR